MYPNIISAKIIKDSVTKRGHRITTFKLVFPRYILAELNTHRVFSRNSASSRAIPFRKMVKSAIENPFIPMAFQKEHTGMQGTEYHVDRKHENAVYEWLKARDYAVKQASMMNNDGITKQLCNRLLEPFIYHTALITATEWDNFFNLRNPVYETEIGVFKSKRDALISYAEGGVMANLPTTDLEWLQINKGAGEIHIMDLAEKMCDAMKESTPDKLEDGEWHIPFGDTFNTLKQEDDLEDLLNDINYIPKNILFNIDFLTQAKLAIATARCARVSYEPLGEEKEHDYDADIKLHDRLLKDKHMSPFEHIARAMTDEEFIGYSQGEAEHGNVYPVTDKHYGWSRNLRGFIQYREIVELNK